MIRLATAASLAVLALAVTGCAPAEDEAEPKPVGAAQAQPVGNALSASVRESTARYSSSGAGFGGSCTVTYVGDETDVDLDGIPDNENSVTASNCESERGDAVANASYSVDDTLVEAAEALYPFNFLVTGHWDVTGDDGAGVTLSVAADRTISGNQDADSFGGSDEASVEAEINTPNARFATLESYSWDSEYVQTGALFGDGNVTLSGEWNVEMEAEQDEESASVYANATVQTLGDGLQLSSACASHVVGGTMTATYDASANHNEDSGSVSATLTVTFTGCDAHTTAYSETINGGGNS